MKVTYIAHSGFSVELEHCVLLFDYFTGDLPEWDRDKEILVFASHKHQDHFNLKVFELAGRYPKVHFFLGNDIKLSEAYLTRKGYDPRVRKQTTVMRGHESAEYAGVRVASLKSTDEGVAFLVEAEGKRIYHAGDLNWWHWEGEALSWNRDMEVRYKREIGSIEGKHFDLAFVPLDPRLEEAYDWGLLYFLDHTDSERVFPMHMWEEYGYIGRFCESEAGSRFAKRIVKIVKRGDFYLY